MNFLVLQPADTRQSDPAIGQTLLPALQAHGAVTVARDWLSFLNYTQVTSFTAAFFGSRALIHDDVTWRRELQRIRLPQTFIMFTSGPALPVRALRSLDLLFAVEPLKQLKDNLDPLIERLEQFHALRRDVKTKVPKGYLRPNGFGPFIGNSQQMLTIYRQLVRVAGSEYTVLIRGNSGTGKDILARAIHELSNRQPHPFVSINCAAIPENLLESELFGYEKGAFTGATQSKAGKFELAHEGTLFMDEVGDMPMGLQAKLLRVLEDQTIQPLGGVTEKKVAFRLLAATHRRLGELIREGAFREDLHYRLNVISIDLPDLNTRGADMTLLGLYVINKLIAHGDEGIKQVDWQIFEVLKSANLAGNVRELENVLTRTAFHTEGDTIRAADLQKVLDRRELGTVSSVPASGKEREVRSLREVEKEAVHHALIRLDGNISQAAKQLGISRTALYRKIKTYELTEFMSEPQREDEPHA